MKIPESIIEKYKLTRSTAQVGESFMHNLQLFESGLSGFEKVIFMECDLRGKPSNCITIYNKSSKRKVEATPEFLNDMKIVDILKFVV